MSILGTILISYLATITYLLEIGTQLIPGPSGALGIACAVLMSAPLEIKLMIAPLQLKVCGVNSGRQVYCGT
jgi:hypothetical protein